MGLAHEEHLILRQDHLVIYQILLTHRGYCQNPHLQSNHGG